MTYETLVRLCLRLYPANFRDEFKEEIIDTFEARIEDAMTVNEARIALAREVIDALPNAVILRYEGARQNYQALSSAHQTLIQARWVIRIGSLLVTLFFLLATWDSYQQNHSNENLLMLVIFSLQMVCVLFSYMWERIGGIIMLTTTFTIAPIMLAGTFLPGLELWSIIATVLWATPFAGFALAFLLLGQRQVKLKRQVSA